MYSLHRAQSNNQLQRNDHFEMLWAVGPPPPSLDFVYLLQKNFDNMCVKTDVDIVDNIRNIPHLRKKIGPKKIRLYVCQKQRRHCRQIQHQNISKWWTFGFQRRHCRQHHFTKIQSESSKWKFNFDYMCSKTDVDIVDKQLHQTSISTICVSKTT